MGLARRVQPALCEAKAGRAMRAVIQRVSSACLTVDGDVISQFTGPGLVVLVGVTHGDGPEQVEAVVRKVAGLRIMDGEVSVAEVGGHVLVVSQFTLYADVTKGRRPSWNSAAPGDVAEPLVDAVVDGLTRVGVASSSGVFGSTMSVELTNEGPMTILLEV